MILAMLNHGFSMHNFQCKTWISSEGRDPVQPTMASGGWPGPSTQKWIRRGLTVYWTVKSKPLLALPSWRSTAGPLESSQAFATQVSTVRLLLPLHGGGYRPPPSAPAELAGARAEGTLFNPRCQPQQQPYFQQQLERSCAKDALSKLIPLVLRGEQSFHAWQGGMLDELGRRLPVVFRNHHCNSIVTDWLLL